MKGVEFLPEPIDLVIDDLDVVEAQLDLLAQATNFGGALGRGRPGPRIDGEPPPIEHGRQVGVVPLTQLGRLFLELPTEVGQRLVPGQVAVVDDVVPHIGRKRQGTPHGAGSVLIRPGTTTPRR